MRFALSVPFARTQMRFAGLMIGLMGVHGCLGDGTIPTYPVRLSVTHAGKPAIGAEVTLHPVDANGRTSDSETPASLHLYPSGTVDEQGILEFNTYKKHDGAPAGEYRVTIRWPELDGNAKDDPESDDTGIDRLGFRYVNPKKTPLRLTVQSDGSYSPKRYELE